MAWVHIQHYRRSYTYMYMYMEGFVVLSYSLAAINTDIY